MVDNLNILVFFIFLFLICRQFNSGHCLQCADHSLKLQISHEKNEKIRAKYEELWKENRRLKAHIKYLDQRLSAVSKQIKKERCQICNIDFAQDEAHLCMDVKDITCEYCSSSFKTTIELCEHLNSAKHIESIYECDKCSMVFSTATLLTFHKDSKLTHTQTRPDSSPSQRQTQTTNLDMDVPLTDKSNAM